MHSLVITITCQNQQSLGTQRFPIRFKIFVVLVHQNYENTNPSVTSASTSSHAPFLFLLFFCLWYFFPRKNGNLVIMPPTLTFLKKSQQVFFPMCCLFWLQQLNFVFQMCILCKCHWSPNSFGDQFKG